MRFAIAVVLPLWPVYGQDASATREQGDQILGELRQIRRLLTEPVTRLKFEIGDAPVLGAREAPVTIMEFTDYQCPYCQRFHLATFSLLKRDYISSGKVRFVSRDLPLTEIHPHALRAAQAARCAGEQGQFWELRDQLQRSGNALELANLIDYAERLKLDVGRFRTCIESERYKSAIENDGHRAQAAGIHSTPSFVIGKSTPTGVEGELLSGAFPYEVFSAKLKALLEEVSSR